MAANSSMNVTPMMVSDEDIGMLLTVRYAVRVRRRMLWMPMAATVPSSVARTAAMTATSRVT